MHASPLRQLAKRYAAGNINRDDYLRQRQALLKAYANGSQRITYQAHRPIVLIRGPRWLRPAIFACVGMLVVIVVTGMWLTNPEPPAPQYNNAQIDSDQPEAGEQLLRDFLKQRNWSQTSLQAFEKKWLALSDFERENARRSLWHRRLYAETQQEIREIEALQAIKSDPQLILQKKSLRDFLILLENKKLQD